MADTQTQDQTNQANQQQPAQNNDAPSPMPNTQPEAKAQPSGYRGNNPSTAGPGETHVQSATPDNKQAQLNPSAPGETGTTPGSNAKEA
ncbi:MAG TPA: hypothetical protein VKV02_10085 [Acidobacteriaceae bacterium]|nr:hypothetical protein [Acidobacteriaceae bacterium]